MWQYKKPDMEIVILEYNQDVITDSNTGLENGGLGAGEIEPID